MNALSEKTLTLLQRAERAAADAHDGDGPPPNPLEEARIVLAVLNEGHDPLTTARGMASVLFVTVDRKGMCEPQPLGGGKFHGAWEGSTFDPATLAARWERRTTENGAVYIIEGERFVFDARTLKFRPARRTERYGWRK